MKELAIHELGLALEASRFAPLIDQILGELERARIALRPRFYLSTEYGCIAGSATIGLLWTDGFAKWQRLARRRGLRTRPPRLILTTLRHEVGHAFCYVHKLYREPAFRRLFGVRGHFFRTYPEVWRAGDRDRERLRRGEVILLYATRHPDEDFAICFQTWLASEVGAARPWREAFARAPIVMDKLAYVEDAVRRLGRRRGPVTRPPLDEPLSAVLLTPGAWMERVLAGDNYNLLPDSPVGSHASVGEQQLMDHLA